jgi:hypothetical protein
VVLQLKESLALEEARGDHRYGQGKPREWYIAALCLSLGTWATCMKVVSSFINQLLHLFY